MVKIRWLKEARDDLREIYLYISKDSNRYARLQIAKLYERTQILKDHVWAGNWLKRSNPAVREIVEGNYRIIYRIKKRTRLTF